ncbi:hypothetical protein [Nostoc sp.]|uniref:hypothetical protein n=1 Tax=Nostoc sp. TaxID=1180 RepID=UPI002FF92F77
MFSFYYASNFPSALVILGETVADAIAPNKTDIVHRMGMRLFLRSPLVETRFIASSSYPIIYIARIIPSFLGWQLHQCKAIIA